MQKDTLQIIKEVIALEKRGLEELGQSVNEVSVNAIELITSIKGRVIVSGMGKSGIIAQKIAATLSSTGTHSFYVHPAEASHGDLGMIHHEDLLLILSNGGESLELFDMLTYAKSLNIPVVAMVGRENSTLAKSADVVLLIPNVPEATHIKAPTTSTTIMLAYGDALAVALLEKKQFSTDQYKMLHPGGRLGNQMLKVKDVMRTGASLPVVDLDAKPADAIIEITKKAAGCAVVVDKDKKVLGIITDGDLRRHMKSDFLNLSIEQIMTKSPCAIDQEMKVIEALEIMNKKAITSLVVIADSRLVGIIHIHDCLKIGLEVIHHAEDL